MFTKLIKFFSIFFAATLFAGCGTPVVYTGGVAVRTTGIPHYPVTPVYPQGPSRDVWIRTRQDEKGLVSFSVNQSGLNESEVAWILSRVDDLKTRCTEGGEMKQYDITSVERASPYTSSRSSRGDTSVRIEYMCTRTRTSAGGAPNPAPQENKPAPRRGTSSGGGQNPSPASVDTPSPRKGIGLSI